MYSMKVILTSLTFKYFLINLVLCKIPEIGRKYFDDLRIVGGNDCTINKHLYMVSIQAPKGLQERRHRCGGTLINPSYVLTAAHCFSSKLPAIFYMVIAGIHDMEEIDTILSGEIQWRNNQKYGSIKGKRSDVRNILIHPEYDEKPVHQHDIALLGLDSPIIQESELGYVNLPKLNQYLGLPETDTECTALGWGVQVPMVNSKQRANTTKKIEVSTALQCVELELLNYTMCNVYLKLFTNITVVDTQFCTFHPQGGKDTCYGDSGGPLVCRNTQIGIVSGGWGCALPKRPAIFTKVDRYVEWIRLNSLSQIQPVIAFKSSSTCIIFNIYVILLSFEFYII